MNRAGYGMIDEETKQRMEKGVQEALSYITKEWSNTLWTIGNVGMQMQCITMKKKQLNKQFYLQTKLLGMLLEMLSCFYIVSCVSLTVDIF